MGLRKILILAIFAAGAAPCFGQNDPQGYSYALDLYREYELPLAHCQPRQDPAVRDCVNESEYQTGLTIRQFVCIRNAGRRPGATGGCAEAVRKMEKEFSAHVRSHRGTLYRIFSQPKNRGDYLAHCAPLREIARCPGLENASSDVDHFRNFACLWRQVNLAGDGLTVREAPAGSLAGTMARSQLKNSSCGRYLSAMRAANARAGGAADQPIAFSSQSIERSAPAEASAGPPARGVASEGAFRGEAGTSPTFSAHGPPPASR